MFTTIKILLSSSACMLLLTGVEYGDGGTRLERERECYIMYTASASPTHPPTHRDGLIS